MQKQKPKEKRVKMFVSIETYNMLANHASEYGISVDQLADLALEYGLNHPEIVKKAIAQLRAQAKKRKE